MAKMTIHLNKASDLEQELRRAASDFSDSERNLITLWNTMPIAMRNDPLVAEKWKQCFRCASEIIDESRRLSDTMRQVLQDYRNTERRTEQDSQQFCREIQDLQNRYR